MEDRVYGPYTRKCDGRKYLTIVKADGTKTTKSYPKHLVEQTIGRQLTDNETVDHIDRNFRNDESPNLRIMPPGEHQRDDARRVYPVVVKCSWCGCETEKTARFLRGNATKGRSGPFCGKSCVGKYTAALKNGRITKFEVQDSPQSEYFYREKKAA